MRSLRHHAEDALSEAAAMTESLTLVKAAVLSRNADPEDILRHCKAAIASMRSVELQISVLREHYTTKAADQAQRRTA